MCLPHLERSLHAGRRKHIHQFSDELVRVEQIAGKEERYPETSLEQLRSSDLEVILLSSEPYPFKEKDAEEIERITNKKVINVDGEISSWYGSRMLRIASYVQELKKKI